MYYKHIKVLGSTTRPCLFARHGYKPPRTGEQWVSNDKPGGEGAQQQQEVLFVEFLCRAKHRAGPCLYPR